MRAIEARLPDSTPELEELACELRGEVFERGSDSAPVLDALADALVLLDGTAAEGWRLETELERNADRGSHESCARLALALSARLRAAQRLERAESVLAVAVRTCERSRFARPYAQIELAQLLLFRGDAEAALAELEAVEDELAPPVHPYVEFALLARKLEAYMTLGLPDRALALLDDEERLARATRDPLHLGTWVVHYCDVMIGLQRHAEAVAAAERERLSEPFRSMALLRRAVAQLELAREDPEGWRVPAYEALVEALDSDALDGPGRLQGQARLADLLWTSGFRREGRQALREVLRDAAALPAVPLPIELYLADLQGRVDLEADAERAALARSRAQLESAYGRFLESWGAIPRRPGGVAFLHYGVRRRMLSTLMRLDLRLTKGEAGVRSALERLERTQRLGSLVRFAEESPGTLDEALALLTGQRAGLLIYVPGRLELHLFVGDEGHLEHFTIPRLPEVEALRLELEGLAAGAGTALTESSLERLNAYAAALGDALIPRAARERVRGWSGVTIVGVDLLGYVPFELLPFDSARLGERLAVGYLPSLPMAGLLEKRRRADTRERSLDLYLLVAPSLGDAVRERWDRLRPIPFGPSERRALCGAFEAGRVRVLPGDEFQRAALDPERLRDAHVLDLVTHGVHDYGRERSAGLVLSPSEGDPAGLLWCEDVERLEATPLVVVSACGAGRGIVRKGEDAVTNLGGAFLAAGAGAVVLSAYDLDYELVLRLEERFFERLRRNGESPAEALRHARASLAAQDPRLGRAAALVHVVGLGARPVFPAGTTGR